MNLFQLILMANLTTAMVAIAATLKRPIPSYFLIDLVAFCACAASAYQLSTGSGTIFATVSTIALVALLLVRIGMNMQR